MGGVSCNLDPKPIAGKAYEPLPWGKEIRYGRRRPASFSCRFCLTPPGVSIIMDVKSRSAPPVVGNRSVADAFRKMRTRSGINPNPHRNPGYALFADAHIHTVPKCLKDPR